MHMIFWAAVFAAGFYGWVMNIAALINDANMSIGLVAVRAAGIFVAPLGAVLGYL